MKYVYTVEAEFKFPSQFVGAPEGPTPHCWTEFDGSYHCFGCRQTAHSLAAMRRLDVEPCKAPTRTTPEGPREPSEKAIDAAFRAFWSEEGPEFESAGNGEEALCPRDKDRWEELRQLLAAAYAVDHPSPIEALQQEGAQEVMVAGDYLPRSIASFERSVNVLLADEQRKPNPDNALIAVLCDAVRLARENVRLGTSHIEAPRAGLREAAQRVLSWIDSAISLLNEQGTVTVKAPAVAELTLVWRDVEALRSALAAAPSTTNTKEGER